MNAKYATIAALLSVTVTIADAQMGGPVGFAAFDTNHDDIISRAEFHAGNRARFMQLDTDGDGLLSQSERLQMRGPAGAAPSTGRPLGGAPRPSFDVNNDGTISCAEFEAASAQVFARIDANSNDQIDQSEQSPLR